MVVVVIVTVIVVVIVIVVVVVVVIEQLTPSVALLHQVPLAECRPAPDTRESRSKNTVLFHLHTTECISNLPGPC